MSWAHQDAAAQLEGIPPAAKSVLIHLAYPACESCGLVWAGIAWIERKTGLKRTSITASLEWLVKEGHLTIHAYPKGGRGRSTEYVVLPRLLQLSTPRCGECRRKQERGRQAGGIDDGMTEKPTARRAVLEKPTADPPLNQPLGGHQSVIESQSVTSLRSEVDPSPTARGAATPPPSDPSPPLNAAENARRAGDLARALGDTIGPPSSRDAKPRGPEAH